MHLRLVPSPALVLSADDLRADTSRPVDGNGEDTSPPSDSRTDFFVRMSESAPRAALTWLVLAGVVRPSGKSILTVARGMVAGLDAPPPMWALRPPGPVIESFERMRDEMLVYDDGRISAPETR